MSKRPQKRNAASVESVVMTSQIEGMLLPTLTENYEHLRELFGQAFDFVLRPFPGGGLVYFRSLVDVKRLEENVLPDLTQGFVLEKLTAAELIKVKEMQKAVRELLAGSILLFAHDGRDAYSLRMPASEHRAIEEPQSELVIRGPRSGFTEDVGTSLHQVRRLFRSPGLRVEEFKIGEVTQTSVVMLYAEGIAEAELVNEVRRRLERIRVDSILESNYIEELIEDRPFSPFPNVQNTERPDVVVASLLEGKIGVLVDGTPFALVLPLTFWSALQSAEDYYNHFTITTLIRLVRFLFVFIALFFPSIYVAITTFHQEMLPTNLLLSVAAAREGSPFPALIEALIMEITFEALREAGVRLPRPVGQAVSIVGALVIGQAAVEAGIISAPMVIVVSVTGIASFTIPRYNFGFALRMLRFPIILLAGTLGLFGIVIALMLLLIHLCGVRSFGVPYMSPVSPLSLPGLRDVLIRAPVWMMNFRPENLAKENRLRVPKGQKPMPFREPNSQEGGDEGE